MTDTLNRQIAAGAGIPDWGTRLTVLIILLVVLAVGCLIVYIKMKDADQKVEAG
jgi:uncharacterized phage infection (PIP) family protein YhgE